MPRAVNQTHCAHASCTPSHIIFLTTTLKQTISVYAGGEVEEAVGDEYKKKYNVIICLLN